MSAAQRLFTEGLISYHRTDSTTLSERALGEASGAIRDLYGSEYDGGPRQYRTTVKNAQEAHEAIRPTDFGQTPSAIERRVGTDEQRLYDLIWKRAVASQMADARVLRTSLEITADGPDGPAVFGASGKAIQFAGFLRAYVEGTDDPAAELGDQETLLPKLSVGDLVTADGPLALDGLEPLGHETVPPPRYTDASLVKRLEDDGIGRPSTYASIISTIERRGYVWRQGKALVPTFTAYAVTRLLKEHFAALVELGFTGLIEQGLDEISKGERDRGDFLDEFYNGDRAADWPGLKHLVENQEQIDYPLIALGEAAGHRGAGRRPHRALRPVHPARRGRRREDRVDPRRHGPGRSRPGARDRAGRGPGEGSGQGRRRPGDRHADLPDDRPLRPVRPARRDARARKRGEAHGVPP